MTTKTTGFEFQGDLTPAMLRVLLVADRRASTHSGRGGWSETVMRAMERRGLVVRGAKRTWETEWMFTGLGMALSGFFVEQRRARFVS